MGNLCLYRGSTGGISLLLLNLSSGSLFMIGRNAELRGLRSPVEISIGFDDYLAVGQYNGSVPIKFMNGYQDFLRVDSIYSNASAAFIRGSIALENTATQLNEQDITIRWGDGEDSGATIPSGSGWAVGEMYLYSDFSGKLIMARFDLSRCTFMLLIKSSTIGEQLDIQFGDFDESAPF